MRYLQTKMVPAELPPRFSTNSLKFLAALKRHNDREWFQPRKSVYERDLKLPLLALVAEINTALERFAPAHVRDPSKCAMRLYRDIRFSTDKRPYKTHVAAWWARAGLEKTSGAGFYFELSATRILCAAGVYMPDKDQTLAIRRMLLGRHEDYRALLLTRPMRKAGLVAGDGLPLTRAPKGFPADHPAGDLLRQRQWAVAVELPAAAALEATLAAVVAERFRAAAPLVELLNAPLLPTRKKPIF